MITSRHTAPLASTTGLAKRFRRELPRSAGALLFGLWAAGCRCSDDRPYTPFSITTALPSASAPSTTGSGSATPQSAPRLRDATLAPPHATRWSVFGRELAAEPGLHFVSALGFEGGGVLAHQASEQRSNQGGLYWFAPGGTSSLVWQPKRLALADGCSHSLAIGSAGPVAAIVEAKLLCSSPVALGSDLEQVAILELRDRPVTLLELRVDERGDALKLDFDAVVEDSDHDGARDLTLRVSEDGEPPESRPSLAFSWLSRAAGLSRVPSEPERSADSFVKAQLVRALKKSERALVPRETHSLELLYAAVCHEAKDPRVKPLGGESLRCGTLRPILERSTRASVLALLGDGKSARAIAEANHLASWGDTSGKSEFAGLAKHLAKHATRGKFETVAVLSAPDAANSKLYFAGNHLWSVGPSGSREIWPSSSGLGGAPNVSEPPPPPLSLSSSGGPRFRAVTQSCGKAHYQLELRDGAGADLPSLPLPIPILPPHCDGASGGEFLGYDGANLLFRYEAYVLTTGGAIPPALTFATKTRFGLLVQKGDRGQLWEGELGATVNGCVADASETLAACFDGARAIVLKGPSEPPKK